MQALLNKEGFDDDIDYYIKQPTVSTVVNDDGDEAEVHVFCIEPEVDQIKESFAELCNQKPKSVTAPFPTKAPRPQPYN